MKKWAKRSLILLCVGGLLLGGVAVAVVGLGFWFLSPGSAQAQKSAMECTLEWGRLAAFPASAGKVPVTTEGGAFSRSFRASFVAPAAEIEAWLEQSPGIRGASVTRPAPGVRRFEIQPGSGAAHAEVTVDDGSRQVHIYVCWS